MTYFSNKSRDVENNFYTKKCKKCEDNNNSPLISVVIPVYNAERWVSRAVDSVVNQPYSNCLEIIIINDGSTDNSRLVLDKISKSCNNVTIINKRNEGVSSTRNLGIEVSNGKYLAFLDSDDIWEENFLDEDLVNQLYEFDYDVYSFSSNDLGNLILLQDEIILAYNPGDCPCDFYSHSSYLYKKDLLISNNIKYPTHMKIFEDVVFLEKCIFLSKHLVRSSKLFHHYVLNPYSVTHTKNSLDSIYEFVKYMKEMNDFYAIYGKEHKTQALKIIVRTLPRLCYSKSYKDVVKFLEDSNLLKEINENNFFYLNEKQIKVAKQWMKHPKIFWLKSRIIISIKKIIRKVLRSKQK